MLNIHCSRCGKDVGKSPSTAKKYWCSQCTDTLDIGKLKTQISALEEHIKKLQKDFYTHNII